MLFAGLWGRAAFAGAFLMMPDVIKDLGEWQASPERVTDFSLFSPSSPSSLSSQVKTAKTPEVLGQWSYRVYTRTAPIARIEVNLMEGPGPGTLFVPQGEAAVNKKNKNEERLGFSPTYETFLSTNVAGYPAILESGILGQALCVALGKNRTLTLETQSLSSEELLKWAEKLITALEGR